MTIDPSLKWLLGTCTILYVIAMYVIGYIAQRKIQNAEDFLVAGRQLPVSLAWMTLLATWFGAATLLGAADEVRTGGLRAVALDPFGAGFCLLLAGLFVAGPMWRMQLLTVPDFFQRKFGRTAELIASIVLVPSYFGWIAVQFTAMAGMFNLFFDIPITYGLVLVAVIGTGYTLMGGMWSVTLTDAVQVSLVLAGLVVMAIVVLMELGNGSVEVGLTRIAKETDPELLVLIPTDKGSEFLKWMSLFLVGALGNLPGQDLMQRVFSSNSERTAKQACLIAGIAYLGFGAIPLMLGLAGNLMFPTQMEVDILPTMAHAFLHPVVAVVFVVALLSAVLSTIDSAILAPASVLAQNLFPRIGYSDTLKTNRVAVSIVACCSLGVAFVGKRVYELLESSYSLMLVGLFVPMMLGIYSRPRSGRPAIAALVVGSLTWAVHYGIGWEYFLQPLALFESMRLPVSLTATVLALVAYFVFEPPWKIEWHQPSPS
ncbi:sodium:solute symporter family protein [Novipirellula artificiosorum]|uniref:Sodium/proline symporter n=1 Tax=Novipirellula artificiosorum TaxID=2528016 RepID=A0A5C6D661_9BACT|nr:sodium:solute symporter family protein [Novipirellula artificiosorum]TWU30726.1 Sodium/proline symporter [Novipirellula artificiosorum]